MADEFLDEEEWPEGPPESPWERRAAERRAALFFSQQPEFLGYWLELYREAEALSPTALARSLGCEPDVLPQLSLCFRPRAELLWEDTLRLAERFGLNQHALCNLLLDAETHAAAQQAAAASSRTEKHSPLPPAIFAAASDREPEQETSDTAERSVPGENHGR